MKIALLVLPGINKGKIICDTSIFSPYISLGYGGVLQENPKDGGKYYESKLGIDIIIVF
jgi:hypothetical protein